MAEWTEEWLQTLPLRPGKKPKEYKDPILAHHRLVVGAASKVFELQKERPKRFGERRTWKPKIGNPPPMTIKEARAIAYEMLGLIEQGKDPHAALSRSGGATTLAVAW